MITRHQSGFAALPVVSAIGLIFTATLLLLLKGSLLNQDQIAKTQLRTDYQQREESLMRALAAVFPQAAIDCMKQNYAASDGYSWSAVFAKAQTMAAVSTALPAEIKNAVGISPSRSANSADAGVAIVETWITSLSGIVGSVTPGTTDFSDIFNDPRFKGKTPPLLACTGPLQEADALRPVVSRSKTYSAQSPSLLADAVRYPLYNYIPYPNIRFGYAQPGSPIVAKRNWWAFSVTFGTRPTGSKPGIKLLTKHYILSLYEIPSQLPIEASTFAEIGTHQNGLTWNPEMISITGGVYADQVSLADTHGASRVSGKRSVQLAAPVSLTGTTVGNDFDKAGVREAIQVQTNSDILPVTLSANTGRLNFQPIQRGMEFLKRTSDAPSSNAWETYSNGAERCTVTVTATSMVSQVDQTPTTIRVSFRTASGSLKEVILQRGSTWPTLLQPGGAILPFQTELTDSNHSCLTFYPTLLDAWLQSVGGASLATNNAIHFRTDPSADTLTILPLTDPPLPDHMAVIIRKGQDLTPYSTGLSVVTPHRIYVGDDLNVTPAAAAPGGAALAAGSVYYPPLSIFAAEIRIGTTSAIRPFDLHGQISTLTQGGTGTWRPMDLKSGSDDATHTDTIAADLRPLTSPAELPPVHQMNWLIVIEEMAHN